MKEQALPKPKLKGAVSVEESIYKRRSVRNYASKTVSLEDVSQILWACQGITDPRGRFRAAPSPGALYPLEVYIVKDDGVFHYMPTGHKLEAISDKNLKAELAAAAWGQVFIQDAGLDIIICAVYDRVTAKYGKNGIRWTDMEAGHAAQNVFLQAEALGLSGVPVGAFDENAVSRLLNLPRESKPIYILPIGYKR